MRTIPFALSFLALVAGASSPARAAICSVQEMIQEKKPVVIGINVGEVGDALAAQLGVDSDKAILVADVTDGMPAAKAGMKRFDVITAVDGQPIGDRGGLRSALSQKSAGDVITVTVARGGRSLDLSMNVVEAQPSEMGTLLSRLAAGANDADAKQLAELALLRQHAVARGANDAAIAEKKLALLAQKRDHETASKLLAERVAAGVKGEIAQTYEAERRAYEAAVAQSMSRVDEAKHQLEAARAMAEAEVQRALLQANQNTELTEAQKKAVEASVASSMEAVKKSLATAERRLAWPQVQLRAGEDGKWRGLVEQTKERYLAGANEAAAKADAEAARKAAVEAAEVARRAARAAAGGGGANLSGVEQRLGAIEERLARIEKLLMQRREKRVD